MSKSLFYRETTNKNNEFWKDKLIIFLSEKGFKVTNMSVYKPRDTLLFFTLVPISRCRKPVYNNSVPQFVKVI